MDKREFGDAIYDQVRFGLIGISKRTAAEASKAD
jgi:hypothetical protein